MGVAPSAGGGANARKNLPPDLTFQNVRFFATFLRLIYSARHSQFPPFLMLSDNEILFLYGNDAVISRKGRFTLVHLDRPSTDLVRVRTEMFDPEEFFRCDCRICQ